MAMPVPKDLKYFSQSEFRRPDLMDESFCRWLDRVRHAAGVPFVLTSDGRTPSANASASGNSKRSLHLRGRAVDFKMPPTWPALLKVVRGVILLLDDAPGGVELELVRGPKDRHIHLGVDDKNPTHELILALD